MSSSPERCPFCNGISSHVYIGNLRPNVMNEELQGVFESFGPVKKVWIARNPKAKGFAFVSFFYYEDARKAVDSMDGRFLFGSYIKVEISKNKALEEWYDRPKAIKPLLPELSYRSAYRRSSSPATRSLSPARSLSPSFSFRSRSPRRSRRRSPTYQFPRSRSPSPLLEMNYYDKRPTQRNPTRRSPSRSSPSRRRSPRRSPSRPSPPRRSSSPLITRAQKHGDSSIPYNPTSAQSTSCGSQYLTDMPTGIASQGMNNYVDLSKMPTNSTPMTGMMSYASYPSAYQTDYSQLPPTYEIPKSVNNMMMPNQSYGDKTMIFSGINSVPRPSGSAGPGPMPCPYPSQQFPNMLPATQPSITPSPRFPLPVPPPPPPPPPPQSQTSLPSMTSPRYGAIRKQNPTAKPMT